MKITESKLRMYIREVLLLESSLNNKILSIADQLNNLGRSKIVIENIDRSGFSVTIYLEEKNIGYIAFMLADRKERRGKATRRWVKSDGDSQGPEKRKVYQVAHSKAEKGFGPLLYEIGLEVVSKKLKGALLPDRRFVSEPAKKVWDIYFNRSKTEDGLYAIKMDIEDITINKAKEKLDIEINKMTPRFKEDDLRQDSTIDYLDLDSSLKKINWKDIDVSLSYAFYKDNFNVLSYLSEKDSINIKYELD